jgi:DNA-binding NtrC family response regulator
LGLAALPVGRDYQVRTVSRLPLLVDGVRALAPALVLIGMSPADERDTFAALDRLQSSSPHVPVVLVAAKGSEAVAVAALRACVKDYFSEPYDRSALVGAIHRLAAPPRARRDAEVTMVASSATIRRMDDYLAKLAQRDITVLITGETGTGKELVAGIIHQRSRRRAHRFVPVNCAAIPETLLESELFGHESGAFTGAVGSCPGLLQLADRGTIFLDEVGDLGGMAQAKILRAIEAREIYHVGGKRPIALDLRIVAATNVDLDRAVEDGRFRRDLYFRLNVARVHLPPLRERRADITALVNYYLAELNAAFGADVPGLTGEALAALQAYDWPGNIRELKNLLEAIFVCPPARPIGINDLPERFVRGLHGLRRLPDADRRRLLEALTATNWNKSQAAGLLNWSRMTVYRKMAKYSVVTPPAGSRPSRLHQTTSRSEAG